MEASELSSKKAPASCYLGRFRLVLRGHATDRIGDAGSAQHETVIWACIVDAMGEAKPSKRRVEQIACVVAGKRASGPVRALQTRCQAHDQQLGPQVAKRRYRRVEPFRTGGALRLPKRDE